MTTTPHPKRLTAAQLAALQAESATLRAELNYRRAMDALHEHASELVAMAVITEDELSQLKADRDSARRVARAWKRAAKWWFSGFNHSCCEERNEPPEHRNGFIQFRRLIRLAFLHAPKEQP